MRHSESLKPSLSDIHFDIALVELSQDQYGLAANELEQAIKLEPDSALAHILLGRAYQNTNRTLKAVG
ncbi:MAG TPA: tetratricopeptide repeat protein, partial [Candidatus Sulfotelmatobacter sp.]|nr:tetratricopeptide repeat protein [Candidatus Sulfotelmatobacter sp.]